MKIMIEYWVANIETLRTTGIEESQKRTCNAWYSIILLEDRQALTRGHNHSKQDARNVPICIKINTDPTCRECLESTCWFEIMVSASDEVQSPPIPECECSRRRGFAPG
ncbi:hypothetical protein TNCV_1204311 [Trichonephila clavipes]|nr:hypothetical protein TNCV_1204311 [Trichonephila clavipes]